MKWNQWIALKRAQQSSSKLHSILPVKLHPKQQEFFDDDRQEILYGGAAGGGKSVALLAAALKYIQHPGYSALLVRRAYSHLTMPGALIPMSRDWLAGKAKWNESTHAWKFPSGASLAFGYIDNVRDLDRYQGSQFSFIGVDEATQIPGDFYRYLFSRLRKTENTPFPLRFRATANPGGISHDFIKQRFFVEGDAHGRRFVPARLDDNPSLDRDSYLASLNQLDPFTRARLLNGDWDAVPEGGMFRREWFGFVEEVPKNIRWLRFWDLAATAESAASSDPDWTAGALLGLHEGVWYLKDVRRLRGDPEQVERFIKQAANEDGRQVAIRMEQEGGSSGKAVISHYARNVLPGYDFEGKPARGDKSERAAPIASAAKQGNFKLLRGPFISAFLDEISIFPMGGHDDQVDAVSGAFACINERNARIVKFRHNL